MKLNKDCAIDFGSNVFEKIDEISSVILKVIYIA